MIERVGARVEVLASYGGVPVLGRQGAVLFATFHPELADDLRSTSSFVERGGIDVRSLEVAFDQAQEGRGRRAARQALRGPHPPDRDRGPSGGGDPASNATLRSMVQKARDNSLPVDTIQRAIKRGSGEEEGVIYEQVSYEGYAASGVAVIVQALTDNRNRTSAEIKNIFSRNGGSFAEPGAVSWQFERKGIVQVDRAADEDELMLVAADAGAEDMRGSRRSLAGDHAAHRAARGAHRDRGSRASR